MSWRDQANRALTMFQGSTDDQEAHSWQVFNHVLDDSNRDDYISHDFFNVEQTAGGLPDGVTFDDFVNLVMSAMNSTPSRTISATMTSSSQRSPSTTTSAIT